MSNHNDTCSYVTQINDRFSWQDEGSSSWQLNDKFPEKPELVVWECPHNSLNGKEYCAFHTAPENLPAEVDEGELFVKTINEVSASDDDEVARRKKQFFGATFGAFDIEGATLDAGDEYPIRLDRVVFKEGILAEETVVEHGLLAHEMCLETSKGVSFGDAEFNANGNFSFNHSMITGDGSLSFRGAKFNGDSCLSFRGAKFNGDSGLSFRDAEFNGDSSLSFRDTEFNGDSGLSFRDAEFRGDCNLLFEGAEFSANEHLSFRGAEFNRYSSLSFRKTEFSGDGNIFFDHSKFTGGGTLSFRGVELTGSGHISFSHAEFDGAGHLPSKGVDFSGVNLTDAVFFEGDFVGAHFEGANLNNADFRAAILTDTVFSEADLTSADFEGANLNNADFRAAILTDTVFSEADLTSADFEGANLNNADFRAAILTDTSLFEADLSEVNLEKTDLTGKDLEAINLSGANIRDADFTDATLRRCDLSDTDASYADLSDTDCRHADFSDAELEHVRLGGADLRGATLDGAGLFETTFDDARLNQNTSFSSETIYDPDTADSSTEEPLGKAAWTHWKIHSLLVSNGLYSQAVSQKHSLEEARLKRLRAKNSIQNNNSVMDSYRDYTNYLRHASTHQMLSVGEQPFILLLLSIGAIIFFALMYPIFGIEQGGLTYQYRFAVPSSDAVLIPLMYSIEQFLSGAVVLLSVIPVNFLSFQQLPEVVATRATPNGLGQFIQNIERLIGFFVTLTAVIILMQRLLLYIRKRAGSDQYGGIISWLTGQ